MFESDLCLKALTPDLWVLTAPLVWRMPVGRIIIPKGFITDLASIPHIVDWIPFLDRTGASREPGALHDGLYALGREKGKTWCDDLLRTALMAEGMSAWQAGAYWRAVHYFGKSSWDEDAREGVFGDKIVGGYFLTPADYADWVAGGKTIFKP